MPSRRGKNSEAFFQNLFFIPVFFKNIVCGKSPTLQVRSYSDLQKVVSEEDIVVGVLAVPTEAAQGVADDLVRAGVKIIFNYSEALVQVPPDVTVHTSSPAVDLLYALYFYLT